MPHVSVESFSLPFSGSIAVSRHCSAQGAIQASERVGRQAVQLLTLYANRGPLTDADAAILMGVERTTVNARRNELVRRQLVQAVDTVKNQRSQVRNVRWGLK